MHRLSPNRPRRTPLGLLALVLACGALAGCGKPTGSVSGRVTFKGKPLPFGTVTFFGADGLSRPSQIRSDGTYLVARVGVGTARISVTSEDPQMVEDLKQLSAKGRGADAALKPVHFEDKKYRKIPSRYADVNQSGLTLAVAPGANAFDIELK